VLNGPTAELNLLLLRYYKMLGPTIKTPCTCIQSNPVIKTSVYTTPKRVGLNIHLAGRKPKFQIHEKEFAEYTTLRTYRQMDILNGPSCSGVLNDIGYVLFLLLTLDYLFASV
jgi:hypothetical protein